MVHLFYGKEDWASNFYLCDVPFREGITFCCVEQLFMFYKAQHFNDQRAVEWLLKLDRNDPHIQTKAKGIGRNVKGFDDEEWGKVKVNYMYAACLLKFKANSHLLNLLINTYGQMLVEASPKDLFWGSGYGKWHPKAYDIFDYRGLNMLGRVLMTIRQRYIEGVL